MLLCVKCEGKAFTRVNPLDGKKDVYCERHGWHRVHVPSEVPYEMIKQQTLFKEARLAQKTAAQKKSPAPSQKTDDSVSVLPDHVPVFGWENMGFRVHSALSLVSFIERSLKRFNIPGNGVSAQSSAMIKEDDRVLVAAVTFVTMFKSLSHRKVNGSEGIVSLIMDMLRASCEILNIVQHQDILADKKNEFGHDLVTAQFVSDLKARVESLKTADLIASLQNASQTFSGILGRGLNAAQYPKITGGLSLNEIRSILPGGGFPFAAALQTAPGEPFIITGYEGKHYVGYPSLYFSLRETGDITRNSQWQSSRVIPIAGDREIWDTTSVTKSAFKNIGIIEDWFSSALKAS